MTNEAKTARWAVSDLFEQAEDLRDYPGSYFPAERAAKAALVAWRERYPEAAAEEDAERAARKAAEKARRERQFANGFLARQLD